MEDDNYVEMAKDPLHLRLMLDKRDNPDSTVDPPTEARPPLETDTTCQQDALASDSHSGSPVPAASLEQPSDTHTPTNQQAELGRKLS